MFKFLKHISRSLLKRKLLSIITIGGFSISMAVILLLVIFIVGEKNVNKSFQNEKHIYRLKRGDDTVFPETLIENINEGIPGVENLCLYSLSEERFLINNKKADIKCLSANDAFLDMFSFKFIYHSSDPTLEVEENIIITQSFGEKWFGDRNPVGETLKCYDSNFNIVGVISDPPANSSINFDVLQGLSHGAVTFINYQDDNIYHKTFNSFIQLQENADPEMVGIQISTAINKWVLFRNDNVSLQPLSDVYFDTKSTEDELPHANRSMLYLLISIGVLILIMTIFNYVNLTVSSGYQRLKEIGIKKTAGASRINIFKQFLSESLVITFLSLLLASLFALFLAPVLSDILGKEININLAVLIPENWIIVFIVFLITGIVSGIFPAFFFSRYSAVQMMSDKLKFGSNMVKGSVVAMQFIITIVLISSVFFIEKQINYIAHKDLGFNTEMIIRLKLDGGSPVDISRILKEKLMANPNIISVAGSTGSVMDFNGWGTKEIEVDGKTQLVDFRSIGIDENFVDLFGLELVSGEITDYPNDRRTCLINERYYNYLGWDDYVGKKVERGRDQYEVIGIVKDFNFDNLHKDIGFLVLIIGFTPDILNIKINGNISETISFIKKCYAEVDPQFEPEYAFYDDWIQDKYTKEERQAKAVRIFSLFAIIISCLGLIGLIELTTHKKIKEIGIRKVNGAKVSEILSMINRDIMKWVVIAFVIASPIAWYAMTRWLENFAYKTELSWWIFALAGILALGIALLTVSWQSWKAATRNPVEALRYE